MAVRFLLNGRVTEIVDELPPELSLLAWLRANGHCGAKEGCAEGECGACAVALITHDDAGLTRYEAVNSCILPLACVDGRAILTVEGVAGPDKTLHPVQQALVDHGGSQCGYCTPGFVISLFCEYYRNERSAADPEAISGNLCRCTGYRPIIAAQRALGPASADDPKLRLPQAPPTASPSLPQRCARNTGNTSPPARFLRPASLAEALAEWAAYPQAVLLAGGTDLMVDANQQQLRFSQLISLEHVPELQCLQQTSSELEIGAGVPLSRLEAHVPNAFPLLAQLLPLFSSRLIRHRATLGGSLGTASPIGDAAPVLLALEADVVLAGRLGMRRIALRDFFVGYRKTVREPGEIIVSLHLPLPAAVTQRFYKVGKRALDDISTVSAAFALDRDGEGRVTRLRMAYGGIADRPLRAHAVEDLALGKAWDAKTCRILTDALKDLGTPLSDHRGSRQYRRAMIPALLAKFYAETNAAQEPEP